MDPVRGKLDSSTSASSLRDFFQDEQVRESQDNFPIVSGSRARAPSNVQTYSQGPLTKDDIGPLTLEQIAQVKKEFEELKMARPDLRVPVRSFLDDEEYDWRFGVKPNYDLANLAYLKGKSMNHAEGSLEQIVEDLVKSWETERSHKLDTAKHKTVDSENFSISHDGGKVFGHLEANEIGNYNALLHGAANWPKDISWSESHELFKDAFAVFPWEVLKVFSPPPLVAFSWRHWADFTGTYRGNKGKGELIDLIGFGTARVSTDLKLQDVVIYYKPDEFLEILEGKRPVKEGGSVSFIGPMCPVTGRTGTCEANS